MKLQDIIRNIMGILLVLSGLFVHLWTVVLIRQELAQAKNPEIQIILGKILPLGFMVLIGMFLILVGMAALKPIQKI